MNLAEIRTSIAPEEFLKVATMRSWQRSGRAESAINGHYLRIPGVELPYRLAVLTPPHTLWRRLQDVRR